MHEVVAVHTRFVGGETHNSFLRLANGVTNKLHRPGCLEVGDGQLITEEGVAFHDKMAYTYHAYSFVIAPKHIVSDDNGIHRGFQAIGRVARTAFWQVRRDEVVFNVIGSILVGDAPH